MNFRRLCFVALLASAFWVLDSHSQVAKGDGSWIVYQSHNYFLSNCLLQVKHEQNAWVFFAPEYSQTEFRGFWPTEPGHYQVSAAVLNDPTYVRADEGHGEVLEELDILFMEKEGRLQPVSYTYIKNPEDEQHEIRQPVCTGLRN